MIGKYFGTEGIRGKAFDFLNSNLAFKLGQAIAKKFRTSEIVIGQDTRQSSNMLAHGVAYGAALAGVNILISDVVSTPMIAHYSKIKNIIGIMITASHNPFTDNGIKVIKSGYKILEEDEAEIEKLMNEKSVLEGSIFGSITMTYDVEIEYLKLFEQLGISRINLKISYDTANGSTYRSAKKILDLYTINSFQIGNEPNGLNINKETGSTYLSAIQKTVSETKSSIGLSFDGDGDRLLVVDGEQNVYDGDLIVYIIAKYLHSVGKLRDNKVVLTVMSNPGIIKAFRELGIEVIKTSVGDKYVSEALIKENLTIGGENSGHIILNEILPSGDGLFAGMYLLKILTENNMNLKEYVKEVEMYPQKMVNIFQNVI